MGEPCTMAMGEAAAAAATAAAARKRRTEESVAGAAKGIRQARACRRGMWLNALLLSVAIS